jgi:uncharacterized membrane protein
VTLLLALLIGIVAGSRAMMAPAAVSWAAWAGLLDVAQTPLAFLGHAVTPWVFTALALGELVTDQLPTTPSRTVPIQFGTRVLSGGITGAAIGASQGMLLAGLGAGAVGAVLGTLGGRAFRATLASHFRRDPPAAFIEDAAAIASALLVVLLLP